MSAIETFVLAADIGGTNARLGLASVAAGGIELVFTRQFVCREHDGLRDIVAEFLNDAIRVSPHLRPRAAAFAVAGPIAPEGADLPNAPWNVRLADLAGLGLGPIRLLNDFEALAGGVARLGGRDVRPIGRIIAPSEALVRVVLGAGTGFGLAAIAPGPAPRIFAGEGGHAGFAPADELETEVLRVLRGRFGRVSIERLVSGPGLQNLYAALGQVEGTYADPDLRPEDIARLGVNHRDALCSAALQRFCAIFGSVAGDAALAFGARGGTFVAGALANSIASMLDAGPFRERFEAKGRLRAYVSDIPTLLVTDPQAPLIGAAACAPGDFEDVAMSRIDNVT